MKRILFAFVLVSLTANVVSAQQKEASISVVGGSVFDFGDMKKANGSVTHVFKIKNDGEVSLTIVRVVPSCGCTTPEWTKEPIAPGKTGEIKVTFNPENFSGPFTKTISVYSDGKAGSYILTIKGNIVSAT